MSVFIVLEFLLYQSSLFLHLMVSDFTVSKFLLCQLSLFRNFDCVGFHCSGIFIVLDFIAVEFFFHFQNSLCRNSDCVWCVVLKF